MIALGACEVANTEPKADIGQRVLARALERQGVEVRRSGKKLLAELQPLLRVLGLLPGLVLLREGLRFALLRVAGSRNESSSKQ